ncbi:major facilitator superfamily transporter [Apiospora phragmitis]|uniref:Major facilitator superfamily transporter n=1 Tax=Apiospora phragmitis TaxID=2905665 RepID=A0ABR1VE12_9PEZI
MAENKNAISGAPPEEFPAAAQPIPYSPFAIWQKRWILFLAAFAAMFSPMSSFIFYPAITSIAESLHTTVGMIDLAITTYMVVSGVTPAILGGAADNMGRRPVYIIALSIFLAANIGLALQSNYTSLLVLRMVQSAGSSGIPPDTFHSRI